VSGRCGDGRVFRQLTRNGIRFHSVSFWHLVYNKLKIYLNLQYAKNAYCLCSKFTLLEHIVLISNCFLFLQQLDLTKFLNIKNLNYKEFPYSLINLSFRVGKSPFQNGTIWFSISAEFCFRNTRTIKDFLTVQISW